jgi:hypothetical protein
MNDQVADGLVWVAWLGAGFAMLLYEDHLAHGKLQLMICQEIELTISHRRGADRGRRSSVLCRRSYYMG